MNISSLLFALLLFFAACQPQTEDPGYELFSVAYIEVKIPEIPNDTIYAEARVSMNIPPKSSRSALLEISNSGTYYLQTEIDRPAVSTLVINDTSLNVVVVPNDTVSISISFDDKELLADFSGKHKEINGFLAAKQRRMGYRDLRVPLNEIIQPQVKYADVLARTDSLVANEIGFLESYLLNARLPDWFVQFERAEIIYTGAGFKQFMPGYNARLELFQDTLPSNYYDFLSSLRINNEDAILSERYVWFLNDFFTRDLAYEEFEALSGYSRMAKVIGQSHKNAQEQLTGNVKRIYNQHLFTSMCQYASDTVAFDSLARAFEIEDGKAFKKLISTTSNTENGPAKVHSGDVVLNFTLVDENDSLVSLGDFHDKVVYINFWATWCGPCIKSFPALNQMINEYSTRDDIVFLNVCLYSTKDSWLKMIRKESLGGINLFPEGNWTELLTKEFGIVSVPTYVLLNKQNKLFENHTDKAPFAKDKIAHLLKAVD